MSTSIVLPPGPPDPETEALEIVVRLMSGEATTADARAIEAWRAMDAAHERAFRDAVLLWRGLRAASCSRAAT